MKKALLFIICLLFALTLCACSNTPTGDEVGGSVTPGVESDDINSSVGFDTNNVSFLSAYNYAKELGFEETLEEFIELISGKDGINGTNGADGKDGTDGKDGETIAKIEFDELGRLVITLTDGTVLAPVEFPQKEVHVHSFGEWLDFPGNRIEECDNRLYYRTCSSCDTKDFKQGTYEDHVLTTVTTSHTCEKSGYDTTTCANCDMLEITNEVTATGHSLKEKYSKDDSYHWLECNNCDELINLAEHTLGDDYHCTVCNYSFYTSGIIYEISDDGSLSVVGYDGYSPEVVIPSEYQGLPVRSIADSAFSGCGIACVIIPTSVTSIGYKAFFNCTKLIIVSIGNGVTTIGNDAFAGCNKLFYVVNKSQLEITRGSLDHGGIAYNAISVNSINVWLDYVDDYIFVSDNVKIYLVDYEGTDTSLTLPTYYEQYYEISPNAFANNTHVSEVIIPDGVTALGAGCFSGCTELTYLTLGQDLMTIGEGAFDGADNLEYIYVNDIYSFASISILDKTFSGINFIYENGCEVINPFYNPSIAVIYIIDASGSMFTSDVFEESKLYYALQGVEAGLDALEKDDYVGIMYFAEYYTEVLGLTSCAEQDKILAALDQSPTSGGGSYGLSNAISAAGQMLAAFNEADEKHIVIITDGEFYDVEPIGSALQENAYRGIQTSIVGIEVPSLYGSHIRNLLTNYAGMTSDYYYEIRHLSETYTVIRDVIFKITFY